VEKKCLGEARQQDYARLTKRLRNAEAELKKTHIRQALDIERKLAPLLSSIPPTTDDIPDYIPIAPTTTGGATATATATATSATSDRPSSTPWDDSNSERQRGAVRRTRAVPIATPPQRYNVAASNVTAGNSGARTYRLTGGRIPPLSNNTTSTPAAKSSMAMGSMGEEKERSNGSGNGHGHGSDIRDSKESSSILPPMKSNNYGHHSNNNNNGNSVTSSTGSLTSLTSRRPVPPSSTRRSTASLQQQSQQQQQQPSAVIRRPSARELAAQGRTDL
jgi:hypothetical protein